MARRLISVTKRDCYRLPQLSDFNLYDKKVFGKLDLVKPYHQLPVHPDIEKTAVITPLVFLNFMKAIWTPERRTDIATLHECSFPRIKYGFYFYG